MKSICTFISLFCTGCFVLTGQISVDDSGYTVEELVREVLIKSDCAETSNYSSLTGTSQNINGIGYFNRNGSDFPYEEGIVLSTGRARNARGPNTSINDSGSEAWPGDPDLRQITSTNNLFNATYIQFDFVPATNSISFNFLFASEEYQENYQCIYSDVFAFILTDSNGQSTNLAIIPDTNQPVRATTIRPGVEGQCGANNLDYFDKINGAQDAISFHGQTKSLKAESEVNAGETYTIKLVISDNQDSQVDSAVFLEAGSFTLGVDLGEDRTIANRNPACIGETIALDVSTEGIQDYRWFKDGTEIAEWAGRPQVDLTESGDYQVNMIFTTTCISQGNIAVEFIDPPQIEAMPTDIAACDIDGDGVEVFDFSSNGAQMIGAQNKSIYEVTYFNSDADARAFENPIENPTAYESSGSKTIYSRISSGESCYEIASFELRTRQLDFVSDLQASYALCFDNQGELIEPLPAIDTGLSASEYAFSWYRETPSEENRIPNATGASLTVSELGTYHLKLRNLEFGCEFSVSTEVVPSRQPTDFRVQFVSDLFTDNNTVEIRAEGESDYLFAIDEGDFGTSNRFENLIPGEHIAYITDSNRCSVLSEEFLVVDYPRFFTPNGDGANDVWRLVGFEQIEDARITIFDKYGTLLYSFANDEGWDGSVNGRRLPASDYWFHISYVIENEPKEYKGHFTLKR